MAEWRWRPSRPDEALCPLKHCQQARCLAGRGSFPPYRWHFSAKALEVTRAIALDGVCLRNKCVEDHDLGYELMSRIAQTIIQRLQATRLQLLDVYQVRK